MNKVIVAPSILSIDYSKTSEQLDELKNSKAAWLHFDVMDGHFVPNITFGTDLLKGFKKRTDLFMDVHLMIDRPDVYYKKFIDNGADLITFHYESFESVEQCKKLCDEIHSLNTLCGISIKPATSPEVLKPLLSDLDVVLIMSVEPGFGGQSFQTASLDKVKWLKEYKEKHGCSYKIEIDGGINDVTANMAKEAGCEVLVAGSYVFKNNIYKAVESLL